MVLTMKDLKVRKTNLSTQRSERLTLYTKIHTQRQRP